MTTLNNYTVGLGLNASGLIDNSKLARGEFAALTRDIRGMVSPGERLTAAVNRWDKALAEGAVTVDTHAEAVRRLNEKYTVLAKVVEAADPPLIEHKQHVDAGAAALMNYGKSLATAYLGFEGARRGVSALKESASRIDDLVNRSKMLGESVPNLQRFDYALQQIANLSSEESEKFLVKLTRSIGEATLGSSKMGDSFKRLGLNISELSAMSPVEQFLATSKALSGIENPAQRAAEATRIFGKQGADLLPILTAQQGEIGSLVEQADSLGLTLDSIKAEKVAAANDSLDAMYLTLNSISDELVGEIAPAVHSLAQQFTSTSDSISPMVYLVGRFADGMALSAAAGAEVRDTIVDTGKAMFAIASGDLTKFKNGFKEIVTLSNFDNFFKRYEEMQNQASAATRREVPIAAEPSQIREKDKVTEKESKNRESDKQNITSRDRSLANERSILEQRKLLGQTKDQEVMRERMLLSDRRRAGIEAERSRIDAMKSSVKNIKIDSPSGRDLGSTNASDAIANAINAPIAAIAKANEEKRLKVAENQLNAQERLLTKTEEVRVLLAQLNDNKPRNVR